MNSWRRLSFRHGNPLAVEHLPGFLAERLRVIKNHTVVKSSSLIGKPARSFWAPSR